MLQNFFLSIEMSSKEAVWNNKYVKHALEAATESVLQKKLFLKNFANFTRKHLCCSLFLITLNFVSKIY